VNLFAIIRIKFIGQLFHYPPALFAPLINAIIKISQ